MLRHSPEIDAFPGNTWIWETREKAKHPDEIPEASEHINALFGDGSQFHETHGFYIDGVDQNTAMLAIAPSPEDVIVSKLARLEERIARSLRRSTSRGHSIRT